MIRLRGSLKSTILQKANDNGRKKIGGWRHFVWKYTNSAIQKGINNAFSFYSKLPARFTSRIGNIFHSLYKFTERSNLNSYESCHYSMFCTTEVIDNKMSDYVLSWSLTSRYHRFMIIMVTQSYLSCTCLWRLLTGTCCAVIISWIGHASSKGIPDSLAIYSQSSSNMLLLCTIFSPGFLSEMLTSGLNRI